MNQSVVIYYDKKSNKIQRVDFYRDQNPNCPHTEVLESLEKLSADWNARSENPTFTKVITDPIVEAAFCWVKPQTSPFKSVSELIEEIESARAGIESYLSDLERITERLSETKDSEECD